MIPNILILTEGETERIYVSHLKERDANYSIHVQKYGGSGAMKILQTCEKVFKNKGMTRQNGDLAVCMIDVDQNTKDDLDNAITYAKKKNILLIVSNPCIESFFMLHFKEIVPNMSSAEMKEMISSYIKGYSETGDYWQDLLEGKEKAIERTRSFVLNIETINQGTVGSNIYELFDLLERMKSKKN